MELNLVILVEPVDLTVDLMVVMTLIEIVLQNLVAAAAEQPTFV